MLRVSGLTPYEQHAWEVRVQAQCGTQGLPLSNANPVTGYPLLEADADGNAFLAVTLPGEIDVQPTWQYFSIRVYSEPTTASATIRCGMLIDTPEYAPVGSSHWW
jgi:hypothetical protein